MELHELEPSSQLVLLRGAGHCANVDTPKEFNEVVAEFLAKQEASTPIK